MPRCVGLIPMTVSVSMFVAAVPGFAEPPVPKPAPTPPQARAPETMPAPLEPAAPVVPPSATSGDDITGSMGFGVGVIPGTSSLIKPDTSVLTFKYWRTDKVAWVPRFRLSLHKVSGQNLAWSFEPSALVSVTLLRGASTRFEVGAGVGLALGKNQDPATAASSDTFVGIFLPVQIGVEHFFSSWFSMGISARFNFLDFSKQGNRSELDFEISNTEYLGSLFIYTD